MKPFPTTFADVTQPLSELLNNTADKDLLRQLAVKNYEVRLGLTPEFADAIARVAEQPSIREYCARYQSDRFANR